ncbi:P1 family peptidase [Nonomuraea sp. MCN248]|uniref:P1 family peptidase n=1 Tax=Nonomuraea corallina TaxID=2989783 RepID=A0ABT4SHR9_9ACTN|nr:P1 family peptidase [Nonomuraea corallina]MDA0636759.1 P1 family peptidase [Nonomuraea corallina]
MRARDLGLTPGDRGPHDAITDVPGVRVGHVTLVRDPGIRTGVTAVVPDGIGPHAPLPAGLFTGNGHGKLVGATQLAELGALESPIVLTATLSAFRAADALVTWLLAQPAHAGVRTFNPVVGECNDGHLSDIRARPVTEAHVLEAVATAGGGPVAEGCVGAGTGTTALGFKSGIGTASRVVRAEGADVTLGALVQANFGGTLRLHGRPITPGSLGLPTPHRPDLPGPDRSHPPGFDLRGPAAHRSAPSGGNDEREAGSCMIVVATDAPVDARQLTRLARRAVFALGRVGADYSHGSGDYAIAFTTRTGVAPLSDHALNPLFSAALDAVEESVLNSLLAAETTVGFRGRTAHALPASRLPDLLGTGTPGDHPRESR